MLYIGELQQQQVDQLQLLCTKWAAFAKSVEFKQLLGSEYVAPGPKGWQIEVRIPKFAKQYHLTGIGILMHIYSF